MLKKLYPWEKAAKSLAFNTDLFKFLIYRTCMAEFTFDFLFMFFKGPAFLWQFYLGRMIDWNWCNISAFKVEIIAGVFGLLTWKVA